MGEPVAPRHRADPGDGLLHPAVLLALGTLLLNDHLLKTAFPGVVTGKLSDVAGLAFFPVLLVAGWELALAALRRWREPSRRATLLAIAVTGVAFTLVKTAPGTAEAWGWGLGAGQWLLAAPLRILTAIPLPQVVQAQVVMDPGDLIALPALALAAWTAGRRRGRSERRLNSVAPTAAPGTAPKGTATW